MLSTRIPGEPGAINRWPSFIALAAQFNAPEPMASVSRSAQPCPPRGNGHTPGDTYSIAQHTTDVIAFIEKLDTGPVDLMGHSRGGHISFRVAQQRPDLLRRLILAEPGGELDATLDPAFKPGPSPLAARIAATAEKIAAGDIDGGLMLFMDALEGPGA